MVLFVYFEGTVGVSPRVNKYVYIFLYENHHLLPCSSALHHPVQLPHPQTTWGDRPVPHTVLQLFFFFYLIPPPPANCGTLLLLLLLLFFFLSLLSFIFYSYFFLHILYI